MCSRACKRLQEVVRGCATRGAGEKPAAPVPPTRRKISTPTFPGEYRWQLYYIELSWVFVFDCIMHRLYAVNHNHNSATAQWAEKPPTDFGVNVAVGSQAGL